MDAPRKYRKVRRAITNAFASKKANEYTARRRRSRTVAGVNVALNMLTNVKHSSCLYIKNAAGLWAKRWCVLQNHNLHFFKYADDQKPSLSLNINQVKTLILSFFSFCSDNVLFAIFFLLNFFHLFIFICVV